MDKNLITVKEVILHNNCPECYGKGGLILIFKQKVAETQFYKSITAEITNNIECKVCHNTIYPERWTDDIERIVEYHQKAFKPMATSTYIKKTSWIIIGSVIIVALIITLLLALN